MYNLYLNTIGRVRAYEETGVVTVKITTFPTLFNLVIDIPSKMTLSSSNVSAVDLLPGDPLVDLDYLK